MSFKSLFAIGFGLLIAACAASTDPTEGTSATEPKSDTADKTENTESTSEAFTLPGHGGKGPVCGTKQCAAGQRCCGCNGCASLHAICPDIACQAAN